MISKPLRPALVAVAAGLVILGCGRQTPPQPADPARAREALKAALDAWQKGEPAEALHDRRPPVRVIDPEWRSGRRLVGYRLQDDQPLGGDLRCQLLLSLKDANGKAVQKKAVYSVGTSPALTVVREEDP